MIRLSEDGKSLIKIQSWEDVLDRPGFTDVLNPKEFKLKSILGVYSLPTKRHCGLSTCRTPHNRGYLVVADSGIETNIGHRCGKKHFGLDFTQAKERFTTETNAQRFRENIGEIKNQLHSYRLEIESIRSESPSPEELYRRVHALMTRQFDEATIRKLNERSVRGESVVERDVKISQREREILEESDFSVEFRKETVFIISGLSAVKNYKYIKSLMNEVLTSELEEFDQLDVDNLTYSSLKSWNNWSSRLPKNIRKLKSITEECQRFVSKDNWDNIIKSKQYL